MIITVPHSLTHSIGMILRVQQKSKQQQQLQQFTASIDVILSQRRPLQQLLHLQLLFSLLVLIGTNFIFISISSSLVTVEATTFITTTTIDSSTRITFRRRQRIPNPYSRVQQLVNTVTSKTTMTKELHKTSHSTCSISSSSSTTTATSEAQIFILPKMELNIQSTLTGSSNNLINNTTTTTTDINDDGAITALVTRVLHLWEQKNKKTNLNDNTTITTKVNHNNNQVYIAIAGAPGSGKSTLTQKVMDRINHISSPYYNTTTRITPIPPLPIVLPMDGYHYTQDQLRKMSSTSNATSSLSLSSSTFDDYMKRRGAPDTFDVVQFYTDIQQLQIHGYGSFPLYDLTISDPRPNQIHIPQQQLQDENQDKHDEQQAQAQPQYQIVLVEGNYLLAHNDPIWDPKKYNVIWDDTWYLNVPIHILKERLIQRHLLNWTTKKVELFGSGRSGAINKVESSDMKNVQYIHDNHSIQYANVIIHTI